MRFFPLFFLAISSVLGQNSTCETNNCIEFTVSAGTGCAWMCSYCENTLGTTNYYFTDGVCSYQTGGCVGNPQVGVKYTCCSL
jgi:hypothetical protein